MSFSNDDILVLAKAGFNAQQIAALNNVNLQAGAAPVSGPSIQTTQDNPAPVLSNNEVTAPVTTPTNTVNTATIPVNTPAAPAAPAAPQATTDDVLKAIGGLQQQIQLGNLQNITQPKPVTAEDILAEIINPPTKTKE